MRLKENNLEGRATRDEVTVVGLGEERHGSLVVEKVLDEGTVGTLQGHGLSLGPNLGEEMIGRVSGVDVLTATAGGHDRRERGAESDRGQSDDSTELMLQIARVRRDGRESNFQHGLRDDLDRHVIGAEGPISKHLVNVEPREADDGRGRSSTLPTLG